MLDHGLEELLLLISLSLDEPRPPLRVVNGEIVLGLVTVTQSVAECAIGWEHIQRMSYTHEGLLSSVLNSSSDRERVMGLRNPNALVAMRLTLQSHDLEGSRGVDADSGASGDTSDLLNITAEERVARAGVTGEPNLVVFDRLAIKETEFSVPDPAVLSELSLIFTLENVHQVAAVDSAGSSGNDTALVITLVANGELEAEDLRVAIVTFLLVNSVAVAVQVREDKIFSEQTE